MSQASLLLCEARALYFRHRSVRWRILWAKRDGAAWHGGDPRDPQPPSVSNAVAHQDPHQLLTLEITYDSMFAAGRFALVTLSWFASIWYRMCLKRSTMQGLTKETMNGLECGIYVGCATLGGIAPDIPAFGPFTNIGATPRMGSLHVM